MKDKTLETKKYAKEKASKTIGAAKERFRSTL
jgi:hypothetical protein